MLAATSMAIFARGQERVVPLPGSRLIPHHFSPVMGALARTASRSLPFFDDFSYPGPFLDSSRWMDSEVYINSGEGWMPPDIGVATFDGLNALGLPYGTNSFGKADSLTSRPLDLSALGPGDSVYLSFYYQPQGLGFPPGPGDSLMVFFLGKDSTWYPQWTIDGPDTLLPFHQVMIPVTDPKFFFAGFQFRFINEADYQDADNWQLDEVRMNSGRSVTDTLLNDLAFGGPASGLLRNYTLMPWRQFAADATGETASTLKVPVNNGWNIAQTPGISLSATELFSSTLLSGPVSQSLSLAALQQQDTVIFPAFPVNFTPNSPNDPVDIAMQYVLSTGPGDPKANDTLVMHQHFGNEMAYDDGSAELGYELVGTGAELAYDFTLNRPDTLRAVEISFVQMGTSYSGDLFSIKVWKGINLSGATAPDTMVAEQDFLEPAFVDSVNGFLTCVLDTPVILPSGRFYVGTYQLYDHGVEIGLDVNDNSSAHLHYKVPASSQWWPSGYPAALMLRPLFGRDTVITSDTIPVNQMINFALYPNPTRGALYVRMASYQDEIYTITDYTGRMLVEGKLGAGPIDVSRLAGGLYLFTVFDPNREILESVKFVKL